MTEPMRYYPKYRGGYTNRRAGWWIWDTHKNKFVENSGHPGRYGSIHAAGMADRLNINGGYGKYDKVIVRRRKEQGES